MTALSLPAASSKIVRKDVGACLVLTGAASVSVSSLAAASVIAIGTVSTLLPIAGTIIGIALMVFGAFFLYQASKQNRQLNATPLPLIDVKPDLKLVPKDCDLSQAAPQGDGALIKVDRGVLVENRPVLGEKGLVSAEAESASPPSSKEEIDSLDLTHADQLQTGSNLLQ